MYTREQIWSSFANDFRIMKHLVEKIPADKHHHKPTEKQRTTLELLQFIATFGLSGFQSILRGDYSAYKENEERGKAVTVETFAATIDWQEAEMKKLFPQFTDEELKKEIELWGRKQTKDMFILDLLKMITSYKMQLFLYIKQSGIHNISTPNLWAGMDMPMPKA